MGLFDKLKEPVVLKEDSDAKLQLKKLDEYLNNASISDKLRTRIEQDKKMLNYGIKGEEAIMFELKNSHIPMYILHDVFIEHNGLKAQIDYIIITRQVNFIIECKNLYGNITIDNTGSFTRQCQFDNYYKKEGIYSPVTQNQRHLELIKDKRAATKGTIARALFEKSFSDNYKSVVVLANSKTVVNMKYAPKEVKEKIVKVDLLINYIKKVNSESKLPLRNDKNMRELAQFFLDNNTENDVDYTEKYGKIQNSENIKSAAEIIGENAEAAEKCSEQEIESGSDENSEIYKRLKNYRYNASKKDNVKPYFIFTDKQLVDLIEKNPKTIDELKGISGFGDIKCQKYGEDILKLLNEYL